jgi:hypothetical protein
MLLRKAILVAVAAQALSACAFQRPSADRGLAEPLADFKGVFAGDSISNDGRRVKITFDIQQSGKEFAGTYRCAAGNANCRNQISQGWVKGSVDASSFRVSLQDGSWCFFTMGAFYLNSGEGDYTCYQGAAIVEQGAFELKRVNPK